VNREGVLLSARCQTTGPNRFVRLTVSAKGITTIDQHGIEKIVARIRARGEKV
jgi:large subunit ribosomal protein L28